MQTEPITSRPLTIKGARQNNLKNIDVTLPTQKLVVITGLSGSGKSSLAFETIYAEGHRRFLDSLSNYARQFLIRVEKPDIDSMEGLAPTIAIEQKNPIRTSRSTVGTVTEVYDFLRLLFARAGVPVCPEHRTPLVTHSVEEMAGRVLDQAQGTKGYICFPLTLERSKKARTEQLANLRARGFGRVVIGKNETHSYIPLVTEPTMKAMEELTPDDLPHSRETPLWVVVDRMGVENSAEGVKRLRNAVQTALDEGTGTCAYIPTSGAAILLSRLPRCHVCGRQSLEISPQLFSFNSPTGACPACSGFGRNLQISEAKVVPNPRLTIAQGAIDAFTKPSTVIWNRRLRRFCEDRDIDIHTPYEELSSEQKKMIFSGDGDFRGVNGMFAQLEDKWYKTSSRVFLNRYQESVECGTCHGSRVRPEVLSVILREKNINDACSMTLIELQNWISELQNDRDIQPKVSPVLTQLQSRLSFLVNVGVGYLTCHRAARTLSGGEIQRINLANQLGADLTRTFYVLDEPTVGLHPRDTQKLIEIMQNLRERGNSLFVVEHDREVMQSADWIVDMGPGAGRHGGTVVYNGPAQDIAHEQKDSLTAQYLSLKRAIPVPKVRRAAHRGLIELLGCTGNNLQDVNLKIPLGRFVVITGVSGSGKSTLVRQTLYPAVARALGTEYGISQPYREVKGAEKLSDCILLDQTPIGRTPRMVPASYMKVYDPIRVVFAEQIESRKQGLRGGDFSFNVSGGRCETCEGEGFQKVEMYFMDDLYVKCDACEGQRFKPKILVIKIRGKNIHDVLQMTVDEGMEFFHSNTAIYQGLNALHEVGLGYLQIGQPATTLSGGEAQRLKIARELFTRQGRNILYVLDEPTTGLHLEDVRKLIELLNRLVDQGNTVVVIEHHLDVIKCADWIVDLGPGASHEGGRIVGEGAPEDLAREKKCVIGPYLREFLDPSRLL